MSKGLASEFLKFVDASVSPFHASQSIASALSAAGFQRLSESEDWKARLKKNGKFFFTRNQTTICAFAVGGSYEQGQGINAIGSHVDSPCPRVKPKSRVSKSGFLQLGVSLYGGGLWDTWFDRELSVAGRVIVRKDGALSSRMLHIKKPICAIPNLCIHLRTTAAGDQNKERHVLPVLATELKGVLEGEDKEATHHPVLLELMSQELDVKVEDIVDFELSLFNVQPASIGGIKDEFIFAPRLDNLMGCFTSLTGFLRSMQSLESEKRVRMMVCYDHEEVGSRSAEGADGNITLEAMSRVIDALNEDGNIVPRALRKSFMVSNDMAHAIHPNYSEYHERNHQPKIHGGLTIKVNYNQRYATNAVGSSLLKQLARNRDLPIQEFVVKNDSRCGSTIGPAMSAATGVRTIDVGMPQFAMHSVREMCGVDDVDHTTNMFEAFFSDFTELDEKSEFN